MLILGKELQASRKEKELDRADLVALSVCVYDSWYECRGEKAPVAEKLYAQLREHGRQGSYWHWPVTRIAAPFPESRV